MISIGIIREGKVPPDTRVPLTPSECQELLAAYPDIRITVQPSPNRCYADTAYQDAGIQMSEDLSHCEILFGVKEVPKSDLIPDKTYFFFSHTKKAQPYNQKLMQAMIEKNIRMIDYESLTDAKGLRIIGFGYFAGVVGAHNGLLTFGKKWNKYELQKAHEAIDSETLCEEYSKIDFGNIKAVLTGSGRVAHGLKHTVDCAGFKEVDAVTFLNEPADGPTYTILAPNQIYSRKIHGGFDRDEFHANPELYKCNFERFTKVADIMMNGVYWEEGIERFFSKADTQKTGFKISVIADVTCDEDGSVPINLGSSTIADPVYGYDKQSGRKTAPFQATSEIIDVMAVDNLPNELPKEASKYFGTKIIKEIIPELLKAESEILLRATICQNGELGPEFKYLQDYAFPQTQNA